MKWNSFFPTVSLQWGNKRRAQDLRSYLSPVQFQRIRHDIQGWREAITEAENAYYPHRVRMQRIFMDTVLNEHVSACIERRMNLTLLKEFAFYRGPEEIDEKATELFCKPWFTNLMRYALEAKLFGYSLISFGDIVNNDFPGLISIKRENVSPDRKMLGSIPYQLSGVRFLEEGEADEQGQSFADWCLYIATPGEKASECGYGMLYKIARSEIFLRNNTGHNANFNEVFGQPFRVVKTSKTSDTEIAQLEKMLAEQGAQGFAILDQMDTVEFQATSAGGKGQNVYENFEKRLQANISKVILGHADALDSVPGKIGGNQGGEESPAAQALEDIETVDSRDVADTINNHLIPKLLKIGFPVPQGLTFQFKNDKELEDIKQKKDESLQKTALAVKTFSDAGYKVPVKWLKEHTGVDFEEKEVVEPQIEPSLPKGVINFLERRYGGL